MAAYELFRPVYRTLTGWEPDQFRFVEGVTPLSTFEVVLGCIYAYFIVIFSLQWYMRPHKAFKLNKLLVVHNTFLALISLLLLVLLCENIIPKIWKNGLKFAMCSEEMFADGRLELLYFFNYIIKYIEFADTILLAVRKKPLEFLHVYHHAMTMLLCYTQLNGNTVVQWIPISLNLFVHVLMYYYYARSAAGVNIWWKKYLTTLQITQFLLDLVAIYYCWITWYSHYGYLPKFLDFGDCHGTEFGGHFGGFVLTSYLYLFIEFFINTYSKKKKQSEYSEKELKAEANVPLFMVQNIQNFGRRLQPLFTALFTVESTVVLVMGVVKFWPTPEEPLAGNKLDALFFFFLIHGLFLFTSLVFMAVAIGSNIFLQFIFVVMLLVDAHIIAYQHFSLLALGYEIKQHDWSTDPCSLVLLVTVIVHTVLLVMFAYKLFSQKRKLLVEEPVRRTEGQTAKKTN